MRAHFLQHVRFEGLGSMEPWLLRKGYTLTATPLFDPSSTLPSLDEPLNVLIIMGGPMSIHDEAQHPWLVREKAFIKAHCERGTCVLGVCLGAQLIASVLGAQVYANPHKEIGWLPISGAPVRPAQNRFGIPEKLKAFHWHGETFSLPEGARLLASSEGCVNQAFAWGEHVVGLQCHLETTPESAAALVEHCAQELEQAQGATYVQRAEAILNEPPQTYQALNGTMDAVLEALTS